MSWYERLFVRILIIDSLEIADVKCEIDDWWRNPPSAVLLVVSKVEQVCAYQVEGTTELLQVRKLFLLTMTDPEDVDILCGRELSPIAGERFVGGGAGFSGMPPPASYGGFQELPSSSSENVCRQMRRVVFSEPASEEDGSVETLGLAIMVYNNNLERHQVKDQQLLSVR
ncbi:unnamed protein product [Heligmosomoides polygyrus]|uniref:Dynamin-type G domain-containing protein n=1 Tax=Heligmosomoides polygyrus TaxID=6339 RepID=A0A3P8B6F4_HELPZ|nr:unnamed protein product [Heligmosomoides polygyrus]